MSNRFYLAALLIWRALISATSADAFPETFELSLHPVSLGSV
jgi:hypothetical protein